MKKLLSVLIVGFFTSLGAFASADCLDNWLSSDSELTDITSNANILWDTVVYPKNWTLNWYACIVLDSSNTTSEDYQWNIYNNNSIYCSPSSIQSFLFVFNDVPNSVSIYSSSSPITYVSSCSSSEEDDPDDESSALIPGISWDFWWWLSNWVNAMLSWFWNVLPDILLYSLPIVIVFLFWRKIYVFLKAVFTWRSRSSIREEMFMNDWYDKWSKSEKWQMILAQEKVFEKELHTPWMQDKYFYTESIDKRWHLFHRYDQWSDEHETLWKDLKWHKA